MRFGDPFNRSPFNRIDDGFKYLSATAQGGASVIEKSTVTGSFGKATFNGGAFLLRTPSLTINSKVKLSGGATVNAKGSKIAFVKVQLKGGARISAKPVMILAPKAILRGGAIIDHPLLIAKYNLKAIFSGGASADAKAQLIINPPDISFCGGARIISLADTFSENKAIFSGTIPPSGTLIIDMCKHRVYLNGENAYEDYGGDLIGKWFKLSEDSIELLIRLSQESDIDVKVDYTPRE